MNLQLVSPYKKCPYRCPFCVAGVNENSRYSDDMYYYNKNEYLKRLYNVILSQKIETVVLTGDTEPTLFPDWINDVIRVLKTTSAKIEIQTRNYNFKGNSDFDVICYSFSTIPQDVIVSEGKQTRAVFVNNIDLSIEKVIEYKNIANYQATVKQMELSAYGIKEIDNYIKAHYKKIVVEQINAMQQNGVKFDANCMDSINRYIIYRCDGNVYYKWSDYQPKQVEEN